MDHLRHGQINHLPQIGKHKAAIFWGKCHEKGMVFFIRGVALDISNRPQTLFTIFPSSVKTLPVCGIVQQFMCHKQVPGWLPAVYGFVTFVEQRQILKAFKEATR